MASKKNPWQRFVSWLDKRTPTQKLGLGAVIALLILNRDSLPSTPDDWKAWIGVVTMLMTAAGVASGTKEGE